MIRGSHAFKISLFQTTQFTRRDTRRGVDVWRCGGAEDISRISDLSVGGLFLSTLIPQTVGVKAELDFLVQEGNIRVEAEVRHLVLSGGLGLKFTAISDPSLSKSSSATEQNPQCVTFRPSELIFAVPQPTAPEALKQAA